MVRVEGDERQSCVIWVMEGAAPDTARLGVVPRLPALPRPGIGLRLPGTTSKANWSHLWEGGRG